jgi:hypothetical protein
MIAAQSLLGWSNYFSLGTQRSAYRALDHYVYERVRDFLARRHKVARRGTLRFSLEVVYGECCLLVLNTCPGLPRLCLAMKELDPEIGTSSSMSGDGKGSVGHRHQTTAPVLDSTIASFRCHANLGLFGSHPICECHGHSLPTAMHIWHPF